MTLILTPPEKPVSNILRLILMNPRWTFGLTAVATVAALALAFLLHLASAKIDSLSAQLTAAKVTVTAQTSAAQAIADAASLRAEAAERAATAAREAGRADRLAARRYLDLPTPASAERCDAAQALVDEALTENRS